LLLKLIEWTISHFAFLVNVIPLYFLAIEKLAAKIVAKADKSTSAHALIALAIGGVLNPVSGAL
jgi:hypothetical protein